MSGYENEFYDNAGGQSQETPSIKVLREKAEADSKRIAELTEAVNRLNEQGRKQNVVNILAEKGLHPKLAELYQGEPTAEKVSEWATEYAPVFGLKQSEGNSSHEEVQTTTPAAQTFLNLEQQQAFQQMQSAGLDGVPQSNHNEQMGALGAAGSREELEAAMRNHGWIY